MPCRSLFCDWVQISWMLQTQHGDDCSWRNGPGCSRRWLQAKNKCNWEVCTGSLKDRIHVFCYSWWRLMSCQWFCRTNFQQVWNLTGLSKRWKRCIRGTSCLCYWGYSRYVMVQLWIYVDSGSRVLVLSSKDLPLYVLNERQVRCVFPCWK